MRTVDSANAIQALPARQACLRHVSVRAADGRFVWESTTRSISVAEGSSYPACALSSKNSSSLPRDCSERGEVEM